MCVFLAQKLYHGSTKWKIGKAHASIVDKDHGVRFKRMLHCTRPVLAAVPGRGAAGRGVQRGGGGHPGRVPNCGYPRSLVAVPAAGGAQEGGGDAP